MTLLPIDELNVFTEELSIHFEDGRIRSRRDAEDIIDELLDLFLLAYSSGEVSANGEIGTGIEIPFEDVEAVIYQEVAGQTWSERVLGYYDSGGTIADIVRIAETELVRIYNTGVLDVGTRSGVPGLNKRWNTMLDDRVRDTHSYLEDMTVPINADFYTFDGDHAPAPGMFALPQNNINCRCVIELVRG